jgi:F-type H+-transporting ATPase subunit b
LRNLQAQAHFSGRIRGIVFLMAVAVGVAVLPLRLMAQDASPQTTPAQTAPTSNAKGEPPVSEDEQQAQAFLHEGPIVKWTAKTFNLSIAASAILFEIANFLIIALAIVVPLVRFLPGHLRQRKQKLHDDLESARKIKEDADARLAAVEAKLARIDEEIQKFLSEVEAESKGDETRIKASLAEESARIVESAEQEIDMAAAQARRGLRHFAADLAIDQAAKQLNLTPEIDRELIAEFVGDAIRNGAASGGKN